MKEIWNERYRHSEFVYGTAPNTFFASQLESIPPGKLLLPAEGEGRNAVYAAVKGWDVTAFDFSEEGHKKAIAHAAQNGVTIDYQVCDANLFNTNKQFDALALIYTHFSSAERKVLFPHFADMLKPGGWLIMEAYSKKQLGRTSGGPKDPDMLFEVNEMLALFPGVKFNRCGEVTVQLDEGLLHQGEAVVVRVIGRKK